MRQSLNGPWQCTLPDGRSFSLEVPGCWDAHIAEKDIAGPVRFVRSFALPSPLPTGARWCLRFERVSYACDVYVNGTLCGNHEGMWDAFSVDITACAQPGENQLSLLVTKPGYHPDDRFPLRQVLSGFIPDILCTFGGIWGDVWLLRVDVFTVAYHHARGSADGTFRLNVGLDTSALCSLHARVFDAAEQQVWAGDAELGASGEATLCGILSNPHHWSPHQPYLYRYECDIVAGTQSERVTGHFGFRDVHADGTRLLLSGEPVYLRGALHWGLYDQQILPLPSPQQIDAELTGLHAYGCNTVKHCLYIPSEAYLDACDRAGVLQWVELPLWCAEKTDALPERIRREYPRILHMLAGHPSVILISLGCELDTAVESSLLREMYETAHALTDTLVCDNSGSGECYAGSSERYADFFDYHFYGDLHLMEPLMEHFTPTWRNNQPWIFGEFCDSDTLRDLSRVRAAYGVDRLFWEGDDPHRNPLSILKPDFTAHWHDERMASSGIGTQFDRLHALSINHSLTHRKTTLEMTRAFPEIGGYNITSLRDMPLSADGLFDEMGQAKFPVEAFRAANDDLVLCPAWDLTRVWICGDHVQPKERYSFFGGEETGLHMLLSNYGTHPVSAPLIRWRLCDASGTLSTGEWASDVHIPCGTVREVGVVRAKLPDATTPMTLCLRVELTTEERTVRNEWPVFVYPKSHPMEARIGISDPAGILRNIELLLPTVPLPEGESIEGVDAVITSHLSAAVRRYAESGGRVLLVQRGVHGVLPTVPASFWREGMVDRAGEHFLGALPYWHYADDLRYWSVAPDTAFDPDGLAQAGFPEHTELMVRYDCRAWLRSAYVVELPCGTGRILATTLRLEGGEGKQPIGLYRNIFSRWFVEQALRHLMAEKE